MCACILGKITGGSQNTRVCKPSGIARQHTLSQTPGVDLLMTPPPCGGHTSPMQLPKGTSTSLFRSIPHSRGEAFRLAKDYVMG